MRRAFPLRLSRAIISSRLRSFDLNVLEEFGELSGLRHFIYQSLPRPKARWPSKDNIEVSAILVLGRLPNATISYYFDERLQEVSKVPTHIHSIRSANLPDQPVDGLFVVVCRYINQRYLRWIEKHRDRLAGVALFVDDDLPAVISSVGADWRYKIYASYLGLYRLNRLNRVLSDVWVSTQNLQTLLQKQGSKARCLPPYPAVPEKEIPLKGHEKPVIAFHATGVHKGEHLFLKPIIEEVLTIHKNAHFEVTASGDLTKLWQHSSIDPSRLHIEPMRTWTEYLAFMKDRHYALVLVPLMRDFLNAGRSDTKRTAAARMGAATIFSENAIYGRCQMPLEIHCPNDPEKWVEAILMLLRDADKRQNNALAIQRSLHKMRDEGRADFLAFCKMAIKS